MHDIGLLLARTASKQQQRETKKPDLTAQTVRSGAIKEHNMSKTLLDTGSFIGIWEQ